MNTTVKPLDTNAVAAMIGIAPMTLRIWRVHGKGPKFAKLGDSKRSGVMYYEADVLAWLDERKFASTSAYSPAAAAATKPTNLRSQPASA